MSSISEALGLYRIRTLSLKNQFLRPSKDKWMRWGLLAFLTTLFVIGDYIFFLRIIRYLDGLPLQVGEELIVQLINVMFMTLFAMVLFSSIIASLAIYFVSADLEFLHSLPVRTGSIIQVRFVQTLFNSSWMMFLFAMPMFIAYGFHFNVGPGFYVYLIAVFFPFACLACLMGVMGIMILMRYFPTEKAYQILSFLGLFFLAGLVMFLRFLSPEKFFGKKVSDEMIMAFVESLRVPEYPFLPSSWITHGVTSWVAGNHSESWMQLATLAAALVVFWTIFEIVSRRIYLFGWRAYQEVRNAPPAMRKESRRIPFIELLPLSRIRKAMLTKDLRVFARDPSQWSQMFILAALVVVYIFNIMNLPLDNLVLKNVVSVLNIGLIGFVLSALISRFAFTSVSIEGRKMWSIYTAPVDMAGFLTGKFWMYLPPLLMIGELLVVISNYLLEVDAYVMKVSIIGVALITIALVGMGVGMGAMYPLFKHENVSEISSGTGGILFMVSSLTYVGLVIVLGAWPMHVHFKEIFAFQFIGGIEVSICYGAIILMSVIATLEPLRRGIRALRTMDL